MVESCLQKAFQLAPTDQTKDYTIIGETIDDEGRERFHPLNFRVHFNGLLNKSERSWIHFRSFHHNLFVSFSFSFYLIYLFFIKIGL